MLFFLIGLMLVFGAVPAVICFRLGRVDAEQQEYQRLRPPVVIAVILTMLMASVFLAGHLLFNRPGGMPTGDMIFALALPHCIVFTFNLVIGMIAYSFGHISNSTNEATFRSDGPPIRGEETGNPYQPPTT